MRLEPAVAVINRMANHIHSWGGPTNSPLVRMGSPRVGAVALAAIEVVSMGYYSLLLAGLQLPSVLLKGTIKAVHIIVPDIYALQRVEKRLYSLSDLKSTSVKIAKIIPGLFSTLCFGMVFSPEINFRTHQILGLVVDNLKQRQEDMQRAKEATAKEREAIEKDRNEKIRKFQKGIREEKKSASQEDDQINADLSLLLIPKAGKA